MKHKQERRAASEDCAKACHMQKGRMLSPGSDFAGSQSVGTKIRKEGRMPPSIYQCVLAPQA